MLSTFLEILNIPMYMFNAILASILLGCVAGILGSFIILRNMALMGDALSHAVLPGVALSYMFNINMLFGASFFGLLAASLIQFLSEKSALKKDTSIGIILSSFFALGIILISKAQSGIDLNHILFGNILAITNTSIIQSLVILILVIITVFIFYKELLVSSFDPIVAKAYGINTTFFHYLLMGMLSVVTVASLTQVGVILVVAMLIIPASTAYLWSTKLVKMMVLASTIGMIMGVGGTLLSFSYNLPTSATIVLVGTLLFSLSFIFSPKNNKLKRRVL